MAYPRKRTIDIYIDLAKIIGALQIVKTRSPESNEIDSDDLFEKIQTLANYFIDRSGELSLFLPSQLYNKIMQLNNELFNLIQHPEMIPKNKNDILDSLFVKIMQKGHALVQEFQDDLGIDTNKNRIR